MTKGRITQNELHPELLKTIESGSILIDGAVTEEKLDTSFTDKISNIDSRVSSNTNELNSIKDQVSQNRPIIITDDYPIGGFMWFTADGKIPSEWLLCNGQVLSKTNYPELFEIIEYTYGGSGDNFKVPDFGGTRFIRSTSNDRPCGTKQEDSIKEHFHMLAYKDGDRGTVAPKYRAITTGFANGTDIYHTADTSVTGDIETRPKNIAFVPCIKAKQRAKDMITVAQEWTSFKEGGGEIGGCIVHSGDQTRMLRKGAHKIGSQSLYWNETIRNASGNFSYALYCSDSDTEDVNRRGVTLVRQHGVTPNAWFRPEQPDIVNSGSPSIPWKDMYLTGLSKSDTGYTKLPNGMIMQWGRTTNKVPSGGVATATLNYPIAFPNRVLLTHGETNHNVRTSDGLNTTYLNTVSVQNNLSSLSISVRDMKGLTTEDNYMSFWFALGY